MPRKYAGPLQPGMRSAKVPKALVRRVPKRAKPKYQLSSTTKNLVVKEINKKEETNERFYQSRLLELPNIPDNNSHLFRLIPEIGQAGQDNGAGGVFPSNRETRQGTKCRLMSHNIKGRAFIPFEDVGNVEKSCITCRLLILSCKKYSKWNDIDDNWDTGADLRNAFLRNGAKQDGFDGFQFGIDLPVNDELFTTHHDKKFILNRGHIHKSTAFPTTTEGLGLAHMPVAVKYFNLNIKCKSKTIKFSDELNTLPSNYAPFAILCYSYTDGSNPGATRAVYMQTTSKLRWKNM